MLFSFGDATESDFYWGQSKGSSVVRVSIAGIKGERVSSGGCSNPVSYIRKEVNKMDEKILIERLREKAQLTGYFGSRIRFRLEQEALPCSKCCLFGSGGNDPAPQ